MPEDGTRPVPDPTLLTTEQLLREVTNLRTQMLAEDAHHSEVVGEKIEALWNELRSLSDRTAEQKKDTKDALDAALAAQKEAVASQTASSEKSITKSETATTERIKGVETLLQTSNKSADDKIDGLKERIVAIESIKLGGAQAATQQQTASADNRLLMFGLLGAVVGFGGIVVAIVK